MANSTLYNPYMDVPTVDKSKVEISQNFVAFSEYTNFTYRNSYWEIKDELIKDLTQLLTDSFSDWQCI